MTTKEKAIQIATEIQSVLHKHNAELTYTTDDDGVEVWVGNEKVATIGHDGKWRLPGEIHSIDVEFGFYLGDEEDEQWKSTQENLNSLN